MSEDNYEDLLVFGYSCKLFRDDERALEIDQGQRLIPWMGDPSLPIDRYDVRGLLSDLSAFDSISASSETAVIDEEERQCEHERYRSLREEQQRRSGANEFAFDYNQDSNRNEENKSNNENNNVPSIRVLAQCIEKTASFILKQGSQMEILMRTKEKDNPRFQFLDPQNVYYNLYKEVLEAKRNVANNIVVENAELSVEQLESSVRRLAQTLPTAAPEISDAKTNSNANGGNSNNAYSQLVMKIREKQQVFERQSSPKPEGSEAKKVKIEVESFKQPAPQTVTKDVSKKSDVKDVLTVIPPDINEQRLIDQTAFYVAKKGPNSMSVVRKCLPEKFAFLNESHRLNPFYQYKLMLYKEMLGEQEEQKRMQRQKWDQIDTKSAENMVTTTFPSLKGFFRQ